MDSINQAELSRCLFEESNDAFLIFDPDDNRILDANPTAERLTGTRRKQLLGMKLPELLSADDGHTLEELIHAYQSTGFFHSKEGYCLRSAENGPLAVNVSVSRIHTTPKPLGLIVARDISDRKQRAEAEFRELQQKLAHVERLSTMGEMATGLAHELNQPLAAISMYCFAGEQALADTGSANPEQLRELFENSKAQAMRAGEIIRRLRALVDKRAPVRSRVDVVEPIQEVLDLLESDLRQSKVNVEMKSDRSNRVMIIDEIQIQQVLVNLIRNALDAMSETQGDQRTLKITTTGTADDLIEVAVCDTGKGISVESADQIFDAFFSSKSEGMGMGLAISRTIIESHGGRLWMTPNSDRGVTFRFTVPLAKGESNHDEG